MARVQRSFRHLSAQLWRRRWGRDSSSHTAPVVMDAELQQWLEIYLEETVFKQGGKGCITLFQLANELVGHREWLSLYAGIGGGRTIASSSIEDNAIQRKKSMLNVLHAIQNDRISHQTYITNWAEAVAALQPHVEWETTTEEVLQEQNQRRFANDSVRKYVRRLEQINTENRLATRRVLPDSKLYLNRCLVVPRNEHDYSAEDALLEAQIQGGTIGEADAAGPQPLTPEQQEEFYDTISAGPEIVAKLGEETVQRRSLGTLLPGEWLNDEVIHYYSLLLACSGQHFFKSFFITKLLNVGNAQCDGKYEYRNVKRWSKKVEGKDVFKLDKIFFPVNQGNAHWTLAVAFVQERRLQFYDSMGGSGMTYLRALERYFQDEHKDKKKQEDDRSWTLVPCTDDTPRQRNGFDCGVFVCVFGEYLSRGRDLTFTQEDVTICRERIGYSIIKSKIVE